jgi:hypothetical protein
LGRPWKLQGWIAVIDIAARAASCLEKAFARLERTVPVRVLNEQLLIRCNMFARFEFFSAGIAGLKVE